MGANWEVWGMSLCLFIARDAYQLFQHWVRLLDSKACIREETQQVIVVEGYFLRAVELNPFL